MCSSLSLVTKEQVTSISILGSTVQPEVMKCRHFCLFLLAQWVTYDWHGPSRLRKGQILNAGGGPTRELVAPISTNNHLMTTRATTLHMKPMLRMTERTEKECLLTFLCYRAYCTSNPPVTLWTSNYVTQYKSLLLKPLCDGAFYHLLLKTS